MSDTPKSVLHAPTLALRRLAQTAAPLIRQVAAPASNNSNMQQQTRLYGNGVNVLVYTGPGTSKFAVENTILTLKTVLKDQYDVMRVDAKALLNEPWQETAAMVVIPGGRDLPYVKELSPKGTALIRDYVSKGGRYFGICAGAYFGCDRIEFEKGRPQYEVTGDRDLKFFDGLAAGSAYPGFVYDTEAGARAIDVFAQEPTGPAGNGASFPTLESTERTIKTYHNGGCAFLEDPSPSTPSLVLARYTDKVVLYSGEALQDPHPPAIVLTKPGQGYALLSGVHIEYDATLLANQKGGKDAKLAALAPELAKTEAERLSFLRSCLSAIGLRVAGAEVAESSSEETLGPLPTPMHLTFADQEAARFLPSLLSKCSTDKDSVSGESISVLDDLAFTLRLLKEPSKADSRAGLDALVHNLHDLDLNAQRAAQVVKGDAEPQPPKPAVNVLLHEPGQYPPSAETPHFDMNLFHETAQKLAESSHSSAPAFGNVLAYSHVIPSTQTLLDKNFKFTQPLPDGFVAVATHQTAGRGRGRNSWISPLGCLQFSLLLRHPRDAPAVVFIQYLFSLAVCEAVRSHAGCEDIPVHIKWPNDIYARFTKTNEDGSTAVELKKLGGILINSSFIDNKFALVIGHGLNVSNAQPSTCLNSVLDYHYPQGLPEGVSYFTQESVLANILHRFRILYYDHYLSGGFPAVEKRYRKYWIHQDQTVGVEGVEGQLRIKGVNESGELVVVKLDKDGQERTGKDATLCLTPDGNGFDMLRNLLVAKHQS